ncbi:hypothetical protein EVAR_40682_1 [Eumeta japonica]|uniref:Uncharacterized protein n=1 Tax=Eumeta variegata TaxID=151549 RepID=A0A4C1XAK6_EUMVA|nr:hypothetical protein EVAR_40682_1 [Eumeta japonica]
MDKRYRITIMWPRRQHATAPAVGTHARPARHAAALYRSCGPSMTAQGRGSTIRLSFLPNITNEWDDPINSFFSRTSSCIDVSACACDADELCIQCAERERVIDNFSTTNVLNSPIAFGSESAARPEAALGPRTWTMTDGRRSRPGARGVTGRARPRPARAARALMAPEMMDSAARNEPPAV